MLSQPLTILFTELSPDEQANNIPTDAELVIIATIAKANDDKVVLDAAKKLRHFLRVKTKLVKLQSWGNLGSIASRFWNTYKGRLQPLITIAVNALRGVVANILRQHPTVKGYVQQLLCGYK